jgi:homoserine O-succinyltransferase
MILTRIRIPSKEPAHAAGNPIVVGLVNNMPDAALESTERQFRELLSAASRDFPVSMRLFSLPQLPRGEAGRSHIERHYDDVNQLWSSRLDGLIVTGTEPRARALQDEPYWKILTQLIDWADERTTSTIWSCLAAHAVVLHRDGICRRRLGAKLSGVFEFNKVAEHPIVAAAASRWSIPHSRFHDLSEKALVSKGYRILAGSREAGVDMFIKEGASMSVFLQGHPEYDAEALLREYRRDIRRFLAGERDEYPEMPRDYFDESTEAAFRNLQRQILEKRTPHSRTQFLPSIELEINLTHSWRDPAVLFYSNWLSYLAEHRSMNPGRDRSVDNASCTAVANRLPFVV